MLNSFIVSTSERMSYVKASAKGKHPSQVKSDFNIKLANILIIYSAIVQVSLYIKIGILCQTTIRFSDTPLDMKSWDKNDVRFCV